MTRPSSAAGRLARYGFTDVIAAGALLDADGLGLWDAANQAPMDPAARDVLVTLGGAADPDLALRQFHRLAESTQRSAARAAAPADPAPTARPMEELIAAVRRDAVVRSRLAAVLGASTALGDDLVANPDRWGWLALPIDEDDLFAGAQPATAPQLRDAYRSALLRIAADDLTGVTEVEQTMRRLAALADATMAAALRLAESERGATARLAVIAMGKCGGRELNYVSDVDVIFVCATDEDLAHAQPIAARA